MRQTTLLLSTLLALAGAREAAPCTNILVTRGATTDGSTITTYAADSHEFYGELVLSPPGAHRDGTLRDVVEWDTGRFLGRIRQAPVTYSVVGNMNEHQVTLGETTFTGRPELKGPSGIVDYGSLMYIALERARTAREAIRVMTSVVEEYGYASTGESFSVADPREAWILEMIGKGEKQKGALWVARRVPDGHVSGHANQARIRTFPLHDPDTMYGKDVISFAREKGWFSGKDEEFSFADTYNPIDFGGARACESRVWSVFRRVAPSLDLGPDLVSGADLTKRLPLWVRPDRKLGVRDVMELMRDHFEGTPFDMAKDVGAGPYSCPYRWRPMTWEVDGKKYVHERAISTQQTAWSYVAQMRSALPDPIGGVLWFGVDDTYTTVYVPFFCGITEAPRSFAQGTAGFDAFSWDSAFWIFNFVSNWTYSRYSEMIVDVQKVQEELEARFQAELPEVERTALKLFETSPLQARAFLTGYSKERGEMTAARWRKLGEFLVWKYLDGNVRDGQGRITHPPYPEAWYRAIVKDHGEAVRSFEPPPSPAPSPLPQ